MKHKIRIALLCAPLLTGCTVGPDFVQPDSHAPQGYLSDKETLPQSDQRAVMGKQIEGDWWSQFHNKALDDVISAGLNGNHDIATAKARVAEAQDEVAAAEGGFWPQLSLDATAGKQKYGKSLFGPSNFVIPPFAYYSVGPAVTLPLDIFGGTRRSVEEKQALEQYQEHELNAAYLELSGNIVAQSLTLAAAHAQITALQQILDDDHRNISLVEKAFKAGSVTQLDVLSAKSQLASDETLLPPLKQQESVARHALSILAGKSPSEWSPPEFTLDQFTLPSELPVSLPSELAHKRPDILAAEAQLHAASAAIGVATANMYPSISLTGTLTQQALSPHDLFGAAANAWGFAANITQPLFEGGTLDAKRKAAKDHYQAALSTYQQTVITSFGKVADNLAAITHDGELLAAQQQAANVARDSLALARKSYNAGNTGVLQVLDAERLYAQAQLGTSKIAAQRYLDTAQLFINLGGTTVPPAAK